MWQRDGQLGSVRCKRLHLLLQSISLLILIDVLTVAAFHTQRRLNVILGHVWHEHGQAEARITRVVKESLSRRFDRHLLLEDLAIYLVEAHSEVLLLE